MILRIPRDSKAARAETELEKALRKIQMKDDMACARYGGGGERWSDSGYVLKEA